MRVTTRSSGELLEAVADPSLEVRRHLREIGTFGAESSRRPPRHRLDACSMAWRYPVPHRRRPDGQRPAGVEMTFWHPTHWLISTVATATTVQQQDAHPEDAPSSRRSARPSPHPTDPTDDASDERSTNHIHPCDTSVLGSYESK